jgi:hypothetical protein
MRSSRNARIAARDRLFAILGPCTTSLASMLS